jgi:hypothetical protein
VIDAAAAHGLEQQLIYALVEWLSIGQSREDRPALRCPRTTARAAMPSMAQLRECRSLSAMRPRAPITSCRRRTLSASPWHSSS